MRSFFYLVLEISMSIMINLPFSARGPFRITGAWCLKYNRHIYKFSIGAPFRFWMAPYDYTVGDVTRHVCRVCWYRRPPLRDYGPFKLSGRYMFPRLRFSRTFVIWLPMYGVVNRRATRYSPIMEKACAVAWIYYSRNISTEVTCH
jgi:hypothetical protein